MAYNKFKKLDQLYKKFGINNFRLAWLPTQFPAFAPSPNLIENLKDASKEALGTEKAKSEYVIVPTLKELRRANPKMFSSFSGYEFNVDSKQDLSGYCDFILSLEAEKGEITAPVFCIVEAKEGKPRKVIYGCVTNAFSWCFLKLEDKNLLIDPNYVPLTFTKPDEVLAVLQWILDAALENK
jgi:hypothetical protein